MKELKIRNVVLFVLTFIGISGIVLGLDLTFNKPTTLNKIVASKIYKEPANKAFTDQNFYNCVVDAYNSENNTNVAYTENLTDEQLKTLETLSCVGYEIEDVNGLEKLTELEFLYLNINNLTELDVSKNEKLYHVSARYNKIETFVPNDELIYIDLGFNDLSSFDSSNLPELYALFLDNNKLTEIDLSKNLLLEEITIGNNNGEDGNKNNIKNLNLENNKILTYISARNLGLEKIDLPEIDLNFAYNSWISWLEPEDVITFQEFIDENIWAMDIKLSTNKLTEIDLSNLPALESIEISDNQISELDVSKNPRLKVLSYGFNSKAGLSNIDLSNNIELEELNLRNNQLTEIDLSKNTNLVELDLYGNKLKNIDLSNNIKLEELDLMNNNIKKLDISKNINLKSLTLSGSSYRQVVAVYKGNVFDFSTDYGAIKLPEGYSTSYVSMSSNQNYNDLIDGTTITPNGVAAISFVKYNYIKDEKIMGNYEVSYILYNIELGSDEYVVKNNYIYATNNMLDINKIKILTINDVVLPDEIKLDLIKNNNKLQIYQENHLIKEFSIIGINFGNLKANKKLISLTEDMSYDEFTNNITTSDGLTYKIFNGETEIIEGNISKGMNLRVYKDDEVIFTYEITDEYLDLSLLNIDEDKDLIKNLTLGTKVSEFKEKISTSGIITVVDKNNNELSNDKLITSGSKVKIELASDTYEYTLSVKGDVTGTGTSTVSDVGKLYQYLKGKITMEDCYIEAGNVVGEEIEIKVNDVGKLYQYIKGKISSLEE